MSLLSRFHMFAVFIFQQYTNVKPDKNHIKSIKYNYSVEVKGLLPAFRTLFYCKARRLTLKLH